MKLNLPNRLTLVRMVMVPFLMVFIAFDFGLGVWSRLIAAAFFGAAALTDTLDGRIARKQGIVTNFGKFLDPLADKLMVFVALISLCWTTGRDEGESLYGILLLVATVIVIFRELAVTSMRMVVNNTDGVVIAANILGKVKTVTQVVFVLTALLEAVIWEICGVAPLGGHLLSYLTMAAMTVMTVWSGVSYFKSYWNYINPAK